MTDKTAAQSSRTPVAVMHCAGSVVRCLVGIPGPSATITAWEEFTAEDTERISTWLDASGAQAVLDVLPAAVVVCRTCTLPDVAAEQLEQALALQAEAHLLTDVPDHRRARAALPMAAGETSRSGILVAWPETPNDDRLPGSRIAADRPNVTFVPDVAALAALLNGKRSDTPLLFFDRRDGSVALVVSHAQGAVIRAARVADTTAAELSTAIGQVVAETALSVNHTPKFTEQIVTDTTRRIRSFPGTAGLVAPIDVIGGAAARLDGAPNDPSWWQAYGIAAGALLAAGGPLAPLTTLRLAAPAVAPSRRRQFVAALSSPRRAAMVVAICLLTVLFGPWVVSGLRVGVLSLKLPELDRNIEEAHQAEVQLAMYRELKNHAWPMTKLLADVACSTPESIDIEQIRIRHGKRITVTGRARADTARKLSAQQVVALMDDHLHNTGVFSQIYLTWGDPNNFKAYEFSLTARVVNPYRIHDYPIELDYGRWTLADRMYGDRSPPDADALFTEIENALPPKDAVAPEPGGDPVAHGPDETSLPAVGTPADKPNGGRPSRTRGRAGPSGRTGSGEATYRGGTDRAGSSPGIPMSQDIPEPLSAEEVALMDLPEANEALAHLSQAIQQARVDAETKKRLWDDWRLVRDRKRELRKNAGASP